jgi:hypothetical protein
VYARHLALFGLLCVSTPVIRAESAPSGSSSVEVYLKGDSRSSAVVLGEMNRELEALMQAAGFRIQWHQPNTESAGEAAQVIMVELRGTCAISPASDSSGPLPSSPALASSAVVDGKVLPFSWVDCSALNRFLGPAISNQSESDQAFLYGRSMARLLAHEFYHVLAQTDVHTMTGISKARFSTVDLLADHFDFEASAVAKLRPPGTAATSGDDASVGGR